VYNDKGCDCATENQPVEVYLNGSAEDLRQVKQCAASCCGDEGVLLKKYESVVCETSTDSSIKEVYDDKNG
jgi:pyruvate formate lyase activating enzyme